MMKKNSMHILSLSLLLLFIVTACEDERVKPVIGTPGSFTPANLLNEATKTEKAVFTPETSDVLYEKLSWEQAEYGIQLSVDYEIIADVDDNFADPEVITTTQKLDFDMTEGALNAAMIALGLPAEEESTVSIRIRSSVQSYMDSTIANSNIIKRTATPFQASTIITECGDFCTIGIIGSATPGGWDVDTDMEQADPLDLSKWTINAYLKGGEAVKFRANDDWGDNWGAPDFPAGTGVANGDDIPVDVTGYYQIDFNDGTGAYEFTLLTEDVFSTVGIIGDATPGGWDADTDLTQLEADPHVWWGEITLVDGEAKFRAEDDWAVNWGSLDFPEGIGTQGGDNIPVTAGDYTVYLNDVTGEYVFFGSGKIFTSIGIIGSGTPDGWDSDQDLIQSPANPFFYSLIITLIDGEAKFRADDDWGVNWGSLDFPVGIGTQGGDNIPVSDGVYLTQFHAGTGQYIFKKKP